MALAAHIKPQSHEPTMDDEEAIGCLRSFLPECDDAVRPLGEVRCHQLITPSISRVL